MNILKDLLCSDYPSPGYSIVAVHNGEDKVILNVTSVCYCWHGMGLWTVQFAIVNNTISDRSMQWLLGGTKIMTRNVESIHQHILTYNIMCVHVQLWH